MLFDVNETHRREHCDLKRCIFENYILNKARYAGTPFFAKTEEGVVEDYKPGILLSQEFLRRVVFVMKGGVVYKHAARGATS